MGVNAQSKNVSIRVGPSMNEFSAVAGIALEAARTGAKVLVIRNTVGHAVKSQEALESASSGSDFKLLFNCGDLHKPTIHTGRFAAEDRKALTPRSKSNLVYPDTRAGGSLLERKRSNNPSILTPIY